MARTPNQTQATELSHVGVDATALVALRTGVGNYIYPLLLAMCQANPKVQFSLYSNGPINFPALPNVRHCVSTPKRRGAWWQATHLRSMLLRQVPQVYWGGNGLLPWPPCPNLATVVTVHDMVYHHAGHTLPWVSYWGRRLLQPWSVKQASMVVAVSHTTADDLSRYNHRVVNAILPPQPSAAFHRPDAASKQSVRTKYHLPERYWLCLGTLEPRKNLSTLLNAYRQQKSSGVQLPPIVLVGGAGWKDRTLLQQLEAGKAAGDVLALGYVDLTDLPALYATSEVFLMPSIYEGFGMPLLEAQLCGVPVVHGQHASMVEASAGLGVAVNTSLDGLALMLQQLFNGQLPLACRLFDRFPLPSVDEAAQTLWQQILSAHAAAQHAT